MFLVNLISYGKTKTTPRHYDKKSNVTFFCYFLCSTLGGVSVDHAIKKIKKRDLHLLRL